METQTLLQITVSLALGLLLGLQRQRTDASVGGIRTFPLFALLGTVCAKIAAVYGGWILGAGFRERRMGYITNSRMQLTGQLIRSLSAK